MKRLAITILILVCLVALYFLYTGFVVVDDDTGMAVEAHLTNTNQKQTLVNLPFGYYVGIPELEGEIEVNCSDGSKVSGGYVTRHFRETVIVTGDGTCEELR